MEEDVGKENTQIQRGKVLLLSVAQLTLFPLKIVLIFQKEDNVI